MVGEEIVMVVGLVYLSLACKYRWTVLQEKSDPAPAQSQRQRQNRRNWGKVQRDLSIQFNHRSCPEVEQVGASESEFLLTGASVLLFKVFKEKIDDCLGECFRGKLYFLRCLRILPSGDLMIPLGDRDREPTCYDIVSTGNS